MKLVYHLWYKYSTPPWVMGVRPELEKLILDGELAPYRVLDLGCGTGGNVNWLAARGVEAVGVDFAASAIGRAKNDAEGQESGGLFFVDDVTKLESVHGKFDLFVDYGTLDDLGRDARRACIERIKELAAPGAQFFVYAFEWKLSWWEKLLAKALPFGEGVFKPGEVDELFGQDWNIKQLEFHSGLKGWPKAYGVYLMNLKG